MQMLSVNELVENVSRYEGEYVHVEGVLCHQFESHCIYHWPKSEWNHESEYLSSVWYSPAFNFRLEDQTLEKWSGKRIVVGGTVRGPSEHLGGCGHMSAWPAEIAVTQIHLHSELGQI